jgi:hypothetical protein
VVGGEAKTTGTTSFHSISFPNEWGVGFWIKIQFKRMTLKVSIQLVSPTSGEHHFGSTNNVAMERRRFPFN